jgi:hypothetical protein
MNSTALIANTDLVVDLLLKAGAPDDDSSSRIVVYSASSLGANTPAFQDLVNKLTSEITSSKKPEVIELHKRCLNHTLKSLIHCMFRFEWLALPTNPANFAAGEYLNSLGFDKRRMNRVIDLLCAEGLMLAGRKGYRDPRPGKSSQASQFYPTEKFIRDFASSLYSDSADFDDYQPVVFKDFEPADYPNATELGSWEKIIRDYNDFMRHHSWAMKGPSSRSLKDFVGRSGRINNSYQNLTNRRVPLRINTLIDGEAIAEPDFSANHLRMASYLVAEELPDDPYSYLEKDTGLSRAAIKAVVTKVMGATSTQQKGIIIMNAPSDKKAPMTADDFKAVLSAIESNYPWVKQNNLLFNDVGTRLQWLEGEIGLQMLKWSTDNKLPLLAVHDAYAVRCSDEDATEQHMHRVWLEVLNTAKEDSFLETTQYTVSAVAKRKKIGKVVSV